MSNFELIDDYLANRLQEQDKKAFEQQLEGDPALKEDVDFQRQVVEGVRRTRAAELKAMLKNVPVGGSTWSGGKIAAGLVSAGILATTLYFFMQEDPQVIVPDEETKKEIIQPDQDNNPPADTKTIVEEEKKEELTKEEDKPVKEKPVAKKVKPVQKPDISVVDPTSELTGDEADKKDNSLAPSRAEVSPAKMEVITNVNDKKHTFHYQFAQGKLLLFGPFDKSLYEILEIHGVGHALFLFYRENYYMLDERQVIITPLSMIKDVELLKKLKEYRGQ